MSDDDSAADDADGFAAWAWSFVLAVGMVILMGLLWVGRNRPGG